MKWTLDIHWTTVIYVKHRGLFQIKPSTNEALNWSLLQKQAVSARTFLTSLWGPSLTMIRTSLRTVFQVWSTPSFSVSSTMQLLGLPRKTTWIILNVFLLGFAPDLWVPKPKVVCLSWIFRFKTTITEAMVANPVEHFRFSGVAHDFARHMWRWKAAEAVSDPGSSWAAVSPSVPEGCRPLVWSMFWSYFSIGL